MGRQYGEKLRFQIHENLEIIERYYVNEKRISKERLTKHADKLFKGSGWEDFITSMTKGASISLDDAKILNAMETLLELLSSDESDTSSVGGCSFFSAPKNGIKEVIIGRNYDYFEPFDKISKNLAVVILKEKDLISFASIALAGQVYCVTCINRSFALCCSRKWPVFWWLSCCKC